MLSSSSSSYRSSSHSSGSSPIDDALLLQVKQKLDPKEGQPVNLLTIAAADFESLVSDFSQLFRDYQHTHKLYEKIEISWLYLAFSLYVHHWEQHLQDKVIKIESIKRLDGNFSLFLKDVMYFIQFSRSAYLSNMPKHVMQKIFHIQSNLFAFIDRLSKNPYIEAGRWVSMSPCALSNEVLGYFQHKIQLREFGSLSRAEADVNQIFSRLLVNVPFLLAPRKQTVSDLFICPNTGLELDFPLEGNIALETDGGHIGHFTQSGNHSIIHNLKAFALRESGWVRVGITADCHAQESATQIVHFLKLPIINEYMHHYNSLMTLSREIRRQCRELQMQFNDPRLIYGIQSDLEFRIHQLLELDRKIREFIAARHVESLLRNVLSPAMKNMLSNENRILQLELQYNEAVAKEQKTEWECERLENNLKTLESQKDDLDKRIEELEKILQERRDSLKRNEKKLNVADLEPYKTDEIRNYIHHVNSRIRSESNQLNQLQNDLLVMSFDRMKISRKLSEIRRVFDSQHEDASNKKTELNQYIKIRDDFFSLHLPVRMLQDAHQRMAQEYEQISEPLMCKAPGFVPHSDQRKRVQRRWDQKKSDNDSLRASSKRMAIR